MVILLQKVIPLPVICLQNLMQKWTVNDAAIRNTGNDTGFRECHVLPDWLLIDAMKQDKLILTASRTGTHSGLFGK